MVKGLSFKKEARTTGLASVGAGDPSTIIKFNKKSVGLISSPSRWTNEDKWRVKLTIKRPTEDNFDWVVFKAKFDDEPTARAWVKENWEKLIADRVLFELED